MPLSTLCRACGFCCDGTLFTLVVVNPEETAARDLLSPNRRADGALAAPMPCRAAGREGCEIYEARPATCRRYECLLLRAMKEQEVSLEQALATVTEAKARKGTAREAAYLRFHFTGQQRR